MSGNRYANPEAKAWAPRRRLPLRTAGTVRMPRQLIERPSTEFKCSNPIRSGERKIRDRSRCYRQPRRAAFIAAMSIFFMAIIASMRALLHHRQRLGPRSGPVA
jgi:hypothetical protein